METKELIPALRLDAKWAHANEWETPITLGDHLKAAADALAAVTAERDAAVEDIRQACTTCMHSGKPSCPWEGTYHHRGEHGEKIGVCNAWKWRGDRKEQNDGK